MTMMMLSWLSPKCGWAGPQENNIAMEGSVDVALHIRYLHSCNSVLFQTSHNEDWGSIAGLTNTFVNVLPNTFVNVLPNTFVNVLPNTFVKVLEILTYLRNGVRPWKIQITHNTC